MLAVTVVYSTSKQSRHFADVIVLEDFKLHFQGKMNLSHKIMTQMGKVNFNSQLCELSHLKLMGFLLYFCTLLGPARPNSYPVVIYTAVW